MAEYYPIRLGYQAVYKGTVNGSAATITRGVSERVEVGGVPCLVEMTTEQSVLGTTISTAFLARRNGALRMYKECPPAKPCYTFSGSELLLPAEPFYTGQTWQFRTAAYASVERAVLGTNIEVTTESQTYRQCVLIRETVANGPTTYAWLADGYGIVRVSTVGAGYIMSADLETLTLPAPTAPEVRIYSPQDGDVFTSQAAISIDGEAFCDAPLAEVRWSSDRGHSGTCSGTSYWYGDVTLEPGLNVLTLTARSIYGDESSSGVTVNYDPNYAPVNVSVTPSSGPIVTGTKTKLKALYSDEHGFSTIDHGTLFLSEANPPHYGVDLSYNCKEQKLYLYNDLNDTWLGGFAPGSPNVIENRHCRVYCAETLVEGTGDLLAVTWCVEFKLPLADKTLMEFMHVGDSGGLKNGWDLRGQVDIKPQNRPPVNAAITPASGTVLATKPPTFVTSYTDPEGTTDIAGAYLLLNGTLSGANGVYVWYDPAANKLWMGDDTGKRWLGGIGPGSQEVVENSLARLHCGDTIVASEGQTLSVTWALELKQASIGRTLREWMYVVDKSGLYDTWRTLGEVAVVSPNKPPVNKGIEPAGGLLSVGTPLLLTAQYEDPEGADTLAGAYMLLNNVLSGANAVYLWYDCKADRIFLRDSANKTWLGGSTPGSDVVVENNLCKLRCIDTVVRHEADKLTVDWSLELKRLIAPWTPQGWLYVVDSEGRSDGWEQMATFTVNEMNSAPANVSLAPTDSVLFTSARTALAASYSDSDGASDLAGAYLLLSTDFVGAGGVYLWYDANTNAMKLGDDSGKAWLGGYAPGSDRVIENAAVKVHCADSTATPGGDALVVKWSVELKGLLQGKNVRAWMYTVDDRGLHDGWEEVATYTVLSGAFASPRNVGVHPATAPLVIGSDTTLTASYDDPNGNTDISGAYLLLNDSLSGVAGVYLWYDGASNRLWMRDDKNTVWLGGFAPGSPNTIVNGRCVVYCAHTTVTRSGPALVVNWSVALGSAAAKNDLTAWMYCIDSTGRSDGWEVVSSAPYCSAPQNISVTPSGGALAVGAPFYLEAVYADAQGFDDITTAVVLVNTTISAARCADLYYDRTTNRLFLRDDLSTRWLGGHTPGALATISNSYCRVYCEDTSVNSVGPNELRVRWRIEFLPGFAQTGPKIWLYSSDRAGLSAGWTHQGLISIQ